MDKFSSFTMQFISRRKTVSMLEIYFILWRDVKWRKVKVNCLCA